MKVRRYNEWNYQKQLLSIQVHMASQDREELTRSLFSDEYLLERPLLHSIRSEKPVVLLIDEIDKADEEFEAFLLELLSEMQVTIPGGWHHPGKVGALCGIDLNRARPLSEAPAAALRLSIYSVPGSGEGAGNPPAAAPMWMTASAPRWRWRCRSCAPTKRF